MFGYLANVSVTDCKIDVRSFIWSRNGSVSIRSTRDSKNNKLSDFFVGTTRTLGATGAATGWIVVIKQPLTISKICSDEFGFSPLGLDWGGRLIEPFVWLWKLMKNLKSQWMNEWIIDLMIYKVMLESIK